LDEPLAKYLKTRLGRVSKVKSKNAIVFVITSKVNVLKILTIIQGKIRTLNKSNQIIKLLNNPYYSGLDPKQKNIFLFRS